MNVLCNYFSNSLRNFICRHTHTRIVNTDVKTDWWQSVSCLALIHETDNSSTGFILDIECFYSIHIHSLMQQQLWNVWPHSKQIFALTLKVNGRYNYLQLFIILEDVLVFFMYLTEYYYKYLWHQLLNFLSSKFGVISNTIMILLNKQLTLDLLATQWF